MPINWCYLVIRKIFIRSIIEFNFIAQYLFLALRTAFYSLRANFGVRSL
jgi:hypothetical protein